MPCYEPEPTREELFIEEIAKNLRLYGFSFPTNVLIPTLLNYCCEMGKLLDEHNLLNGLSDECFYWFQNRKIRDAALKKEELRKHKKEREELKKKAQKLQEELDVINSKLNHETTI
jgi:hypothetical protein